MENDAPVTSGNPDVLLKLENISKSFPGVKALRGVSLTLRRGEVRALVGENGAGKSTLMRVLSGAHHTDEGRIELFGETIVNPTPSEMIARGVAVIYQELAQAPHLTVAENVLLGHLPKKGPLVDWREARRRTKEVIERLGFDVDPRARVGDLSVAKRQMVEIARALARKARVIVLDEPSAVLAQAEIAQLFRIIRQLSRNDGVAFAYISHRLQEVFEISDTVTVLRDGKVVHDGPTAALTTDDLIRNMVGREVGDIFPKRAAVIGDDALVVTELSAANLLEKASIKVRKGEIVGLFGLAGAGRTELLRAIYGADPSESGVLEIFGKTIAENSPRASIALGLGLVPEDRKSEGLFMVHSVAFNIMAASLKLILHKGLLSKKREAIIAGNLIKRLRIKTPDTATQVQNLSGGNQQKCILARYVGADCKILLSDEPTRGVDVGAKREIYELLVELTESRGVAILIASSELPEIMGLTDRIYVLREGRVTAELVTKNTSEEEVMRFATLH